MGNTLKIAFDPANLPKPGFELNDAGFIYVLKAVRPHRNVSGDASLVTTWDCICAHDGVHFEAKAGAKIYSLPRRCKAHNIGWVKAYPFGSPRPDNAPTAGGVNEAAAVKRFVDDLGLWLDKGEHGRSSVEADTAYALAVKYLEIRHPGILDEPDSGDLLS